jgi:hypothetical protein
MKLRSTKIILGTTISSAILLTACGGGGGNGGTTSAAPSTPSTTQTAPSITVSNSKDVAAQGYSGTEALNSQVSSGSGMVTGVSTSTAGGGLIDAAIQQLYLAVDNAGPNLAVGVTTSKTINCPGGGTASGTVSYASASTMTAGDTISLTGNNCVMSGMKLNGTINIAVTAASGTPSISSAWSATLALTMTKFSVDTGGEVNTGTGDVTVTYNQTGLNTATFSANGKSLQVQTTKGTSTTDRTLTGYSYSGSRDSSGTYTYRSNFTLNGNFAKLGNATYDVKTTTDFKQKLGSFPTAGVLVVTAADKSSLTLTVVNSTTVKLDVDKNGDGTIDDSTTTTWTELNALF